MKDPNDNWAPHRRWNPWHASQHVVKTDENNPDIKPRPVGFTANLDKT